MDLAYNNISVSHISLLDTNATTIASHTASISTLNTKQLDNSNAIDAINTDLPHNYQTKTVLATNFYNKTEVDTLIAGVSSGGDTYTTTEIDGIPSLKEVKALERDLQTI